MNDVSYAAMPLFHVHGLVASALAALGAGGSVVVPARFTPRRLWEQAPVHSVTWFSAEPTIHRMILDRREGREVAAALRFVRSCSSALAPVLRKEAEDAYQVPVVEA